MIDSKFGKKNICVTNLVKLIRATNFKLNPVRNKESVRLRIHIHRITKIKAI